MRGAILLAAILLCMGGAFADAITLSQSQPGIGESILIELGSDVAEFSIIHGLDRYRYMGEIESTAAFTPPGQGEFVIEAVLHNGTIERHGFSVAPAAEREPPPGQMRILDHRGSVRTGEIRWVAGGKAVPPETGRRYRAELSVEGMPVRMIVFDDLLAGPEQALGLENLASGKVGLQGVAQAYAIDPGSLNFTSGTISARAVGNELWKCSGWEFPVQSCNGEWEKVMDLSPGEPYWFRINSSDPAYAETGVATVNSKKPIYRPGETAELLMAILDSEGFLAEAEVTLTIQSPNRSETVLTDIIVESLGIYEAAYPHTGEEGEYVAIVKARGEGVNSTLANRFLVQSAFPFDIMRYAPVSIDPWQGPFTARIGVTSLGHAGPLTLTERLPGEFTVIDTGGGKLAAEEGGQTITWQAENGTVVRYSAQAPLESPALFELGPSLVSYGTTTFEEARPWYLAIDPAAIYSPNADLQTGWNDGTGTGHTQVDDGTSQGTSDYIRSKANDGEVSEFGFPAITQQGIGAITLHVYTATGSNAQYAYSLLQGGATRCSQSVGPNTGAGWRSCSWNAPTGSLSSLSVQFGAVGKNGGGAPQFANVYSTYLEVAFDNPPSVDLNEPASGAVMERSLIDFNFTAYDDVDASLSCGLWTDSAGTWQLNKSASAQNATKANITLALQDGTYLWNVECADGADNAAFSTQNASLTVNANKPAFADSAIDKTEINQSETVRFNASITDGFGISGAEIELQFPNGTRRNFTLAGSGDEYAYTITDTNATGTYTLTAVRASDSLGQEGIADPQLSFTVAASPPSPFDLLAPSNGTVSRTLQPTLSWEQTAEEHFKNYTILLDAQQGFPSPDFTYFASPLSNTSRTVDFALDANTLYYWRVIAYDDFESATASTSDFTYTTDTLAPNVTLLSPANDAYAKAMVVFNASSSDAGGIVSCTLWGNFSGGWQADQTNSSQEAFAKSLADGVYLWNVQCSDAAGNANFASQNRTVKVDTTGPLVTLASPSNGTLESATNTVVFNASAEDSLAGVAGCELIVNGTAEQELVGEGPFSFAEFLQNGAYLWSVNCTDTNGNEAASETRLLTVSVADAEPPLITLDAPADGAYLPSSLISFNYTPEDATGIESCSLFVDGALNQTDGEVVNFGANLFTATLPEGGHNWSISCRDTDLNLAESATRALIVDTTPPASFNLSSPENGTITKRLWMQLNWTESVDANFANYTVLLDDDPAFTEPEYAYVVTGTGVNATGLADLGYYWKAIARDLAGNSKESERRRFEVHPHPPSFSNATALPSSPAAYGPQAEYAFNIAVDEPLLGAAYFESNFTGTLQNASASNATLDDHTHNLSYSIGPLGAGSYRYRWVASDTEGSVNATPVFTYEVRRAASATSLLLNGTASNLTIGEGDSVNIAAAIDAPQGAALTILQDGSEIASGASPLGIVKAFENPGTYEISARYPGNDNYTASSQSFSIEVSDTTPPAVTLLGPADNATLGQLEVSFQYSADDASGIANCSIAVNGTINQTDGEVENGTTLSFTITFDEGSYAWQIACVDSGGLAGSSEIRTFTAKDIDELTIVASASKPAYERGDDAVITTSLEDGFGNGVDGSITTDIILANTAIPWWNASWKHRKPLFLNETGGSNLSLALAEVNVTGLAGNISSCGEVRIVRQIAAQSGAVPYEIYDGDNSTWCHLAFRANATASAVNENDYFVYYSNPLALPSGTAIGSAEYFIYNAQQAAADEDVPTNVQNIIGKDDATSSTISRSGGGAGAESAHGRAFVNETVLNEILSVHARYRYAVSSMAGSWYLRYSADDGTSYTTADTSTTTVSKTTSPWFDLTQAYSSLDWAQLNRTRLQGRVDKPSGGGTSTMDLYWAELNVTTRRTPDITEITAGETQVFVERGFVQTGPSGTGTLSFDTAGYDLGTYSAVSEGAAGQFGNGTGGTGFSVVPDTTPPAVTLESPSDLFESGVGEVAFSYVPSDINLAECTLHFTTESGFGANQTLLSPSNNATNSFDAVFFGIGVYEWNVGCTDDAGNEGFAPANYTLNVSGPDLTTSSVWTDDPALVEGTPVTLFANITNRGLTDANRSFAVQFFKGDPAGSGVQIGSDAIVGELGSGLTSTATVQYVLGSGENLIFATADPYGDIEEADEGNNENSTSILVSLYHTYYGSVSSQLRLDTAQSSFYQFKNASGIAGHVFVADTDSDFRFGDLVALTRTEAGDPTATDFEDADLALNTSGFNDSIRRVWGGGANAPLQTTTVDLSTGSVMGVPYVNSTNTSNFITGILWDRTDDDSSNDQYDAADKEDLVFVTRINEAAQGTYGVYDYEIKVPKTLKEYSGTDDKVAFYYEIQ